MTNDPYEIRLLEAADVTFCRGKGGMLQAVVDGTAHSEVVLHRAFPYNYRDQYISVRNDKGDELGIIADLTELDEESRREIEKELRLRYLVPVVRRIDKIKQNPAMWIWHLETNLGPLVMTMRNLHEHVQVPAPGRLLITDIEGRRCEITDIEALDAHSRRELDSVM